MTSLLRCAVPFFLLPCLSFAAIEFEMRIRAGNPYERPETVEIEKWLPVGLSTNDILDAGGMQVVYSAERGRCFVQKTVELRPKTVADFVVRFRVAWDIPTSEIDATRERANHIIGTLSHFVAQLPAQTPVSGIQDVISTLRRTPDYVAAEQQKLLSLILMAQPRPDALNECLFRWCVLDEDWNEFIGMLDYIEKGVEGHSVKIEQVQKVCRDALEQQASRIKHECPVESWILLRDAGGASSLCTKQDGSATNAATTKP